MLRTSLMTSGFICALLWVVACDRPALSDAAAERTPPPQRIISLAPSLTELLFALGVGDRIVGVTTHCDRPPEARQLPQVGDITQLSLEAIASLAPDLILVNSLALEEALQPLRDRVRIITVPTDNLDQVLASVELVGDAVGRPETARELKKQHAATLDAARSRRGNRTGARVLVVVQRDPFFVAGHGSYVHELLELLGYENAAAGLNAAWPCVSAEALIQMAPDALVDAAPNASATEANGDEEALAYWNQFPNLPAVKTTRVRRLKSDSVVRPGPSLKEALEALEQSIAPDSGDRP